MKYKIQGTIFKLLIGFALPFAMASCMKDLQDDVAFETRPIPEGVKSGSVVLGTDYSMHAFYDLDANKVVRTGNNYRYDLAFETAAGGWHILLNSATFMLAGNSGRKDFDAVTTIQGITMNFDASSGDLDSLAIEPYFSINENDTVLTQNVYVVDRGYEADGTPRGYSKFVVQHLYATSYSIRFANLDGTDQHTATIQKLPEYDYVGFSFDDGGKQVVIEPDTESWDLYFGQYTTMLYSEGEPYPYLVRGVLNNRNGTKSGLLGEDVAFENVDYAMAAALPLTDALDGIGHDWKYYNLEQGFYAVESEKIFIIRTAEWVFYKLHFLSYFNDEGQNGYPQFEFKKLEP
jgi:hypothetical protein